LGQPLAQPIGQPALRQRYTDLCYGYNAFWTHCLDHLELDARDRGRDTKLWGDGFEIETIINTRVAKSGLRIVEVPSFEFERIHGQSNLNTWRDGLRVLRALMVERMNGKGMNRSTRTLVTRNRREFSNVRSSDRVESTAAVVEMKTA